VTPSDPDQSDTNTRRGSPSGATSIVLYVVAASPGLRPDGHVEGAFEWSTMFDDMNMW